jgi:hypothetical protein
MLGFLFGTVCLVALVKVVRRVGYHRHGPFGHGVSGCGPGGARFMGRRGFGGARWVLRSLFERLQTTPGQERAIVAALEDLSEARGVLRDELQRTRGQVAHVIAGGLVEDGSLEETFASHDRALARLRVGFVESLKKVTETLDERQRRELASWLERGRFRGGPFWGDPNGSGSIWA